MHAAASFARIFISRFFIRINHLARYDRNVTGIARPQPNESGHVEFSARAVAGLAHGRG